MKVIMVQRKVYNYSNNIYGKEGKQKDLESRLWLKSVSF